MYKIIFLDIDGVICIQRCWKQILPDGNHVFDDSCLRNLEEIIDKTDARVVISSSWRTTTEDMQKLFKERGFKYHEKIIGITVRAKSQLSKGSFLIMPRGVEIYEWIKSNRIKKYVILDDDSDMLYDQRNNFVQTKSATGINTKVKNKAIKILNK